MDGTIMTRLIFVTQLVDRKHSVLGVTVDLIRALSQRCESVVVVANEVRDAPSDLGAELISLGKEHGAGKLLRGARYYRAIVDVARGARPHALVAHMCPVYLNLAVPIAKAFGIRTFLWYAYPRVSITLLTAEQLADCVVTALPESYPRSSSKVRAIGHSIDVSVFQYVSPRPAEGPLRLVSVARTAPEKHHDTTLLAIASARRRIDVTLRIAGASMTPVERWHRVELDRMIDDLDLRSIVSLDEAVPRYDVPRLLADSDCLVSAAFAGGADKAVLEAMAVGRPALVSNPAFEPMLGDISPALMFREADADDLADKMEGMARASSSQRVAIGTSLRRHIEDEHSLAHWVDQMVELAHADGP
jgi:glycosyltransferase involved in cell wall biosynthesis